STATYTIAVTGTGGFTGSVVLAATGLPAGATFNIAPGTVSVGSTGASTATLSIVAAASHAELLRGEQGRGRGTSMMRYGFLLLPLPLLGIAGLRKRLKSMPRAVVLLAFILLSVAASSGMMGCANIGIEDKSQTYTVTVTGTSGTLQHSANVAVTINDYVPVK
ncbi:MAG: hypothetical protein ABI165_11585, partial [Bryobacteraceae bacterium]